MQMSFSSVKVSRKFYGSDSFFCRRICYDYSADSGKFHEMVHASPGRMKRFVTLAMIFMAGLSACERAAQDPRPIATYTFSQLTRNEPVGFQLQHSEEPLLLVRIDGHETAFESRLLTADGSDLSAARLPYLRTGPVYHVIEYHPGESGISVSIRPVNTTRNSLINVQVFALSEASKLDAVRLKAFRDYEQAIQSTDDESGEVWLKRVEKLRSAARGFERTGDLEEQLWAEYLEAYFHYFPLAEYQVAADLARNVQKKASNGLYPLIEMMAAQLEGQVLIERDENDAPEIAQEKFIHAQEVLQGVSERAANIGHGFEQAWAVNTRGIGYFYQDSYAQAEQQYARALKLALELNDQYLQKLVRGNLALVRERQGDLNGALNTLQELNIQLEASGSSSEKAHNWSELSRLYQRLYLFPQAIDAQSHALEIWRELNSAEGIGRSGAPLAYAYLAMGYAERALSLMRDAISHMEQANYGRGLRDGFHLVANIHRSRGDFDLMTAARDQQAKYLGSDLEKARYQYELGLDVLAQFPNSPLGADTFFQEAEKLAAKIGEAGIQVRARLQRCAIAASKNLDTCTASYLKSALDDWLPRATPSQEVEAQFLLARNYLKLGNIIEATELMNELIDDLQFYRNSLPGVLGAWYWEGRSQVFSTYMEIHLQRSEPEQRPLQSLLALNRLLNTPLQQHRISPLKRSVDEVDTEKLRLLLAQLETKDQNEQRNTRQAIDRELMAFNNNNNLRESSLQSGELIQLLEQMPRGSAFLTYYISAEAAWAWVADHSGIQLFQLADINALVSALDQSRDGLRIVGYEHRDQNFELLGDLLLEPIEDLLPRTVYLLPAGRLAGFPFEAIRRNGRYFAQDHDVINVVSLNGLSHAIKPQGHATSWRQALLAGDPDASEAESVKLPRATAEIEGIASLLDGLEITRLTGPGLRPNLLFGPSYARSDLLHFASHGVINLEYPELSRLILSADTHSGEDRYLTPLDIRQTSLSADLVVLSACETTGVNSFSFDSNLGFVTEFLLAGADTVVASLWPVSDAFAYQFMLEFYSAMFQGMSAPQALAVAKRRFIAREQTPGPLDWPSFQIYLK